MTAADISSVIGAVAVLVLCIGAFVALMGIGRWLTSLAAMPVMIGGALAAWFSKKGKE